MLFARWMGVLVAALAWTVGAGHAPAQGTVYVNGSCGDDSWTGLSAVCGGPDGPKATMQAGIDAAASGGEVVVAPGECRGAGNKNLVFGEKALTLRTSGAGAACVIDCEDDGRAFFFQNNGSAMVVVVGFTVTRGYVDDTYPGFRKGGGVFCVQSRATLVNCVFEDNQGHTGGAVFCGPGARMTLVNCRMTNHVGIQGGGEAEVHVGAGLMARDGAVVTLVNCTIADNVCAPPGQDHVGGAIFANRNATVVAHNCVMWGNRAPRGSQLAVTEGASLAVHYSLVEGGEAGALVEGAVLEWGAGNIDRDPLFIDAEGLDYRLAGGSPAIDAADNGAAPADSGDVDGDGDEAEPVPHDVTGRARFVDDPETADTGDAGGTGLPIADMGAYELQAGCRADFNADGVVDTQDVLAFLNAWAAGEDGADFNGDGVVNTRDVLAFLNAWTEGC